MTTRWNGYRLGGCLLEDVPMSAPELSTQAGGLPERVDLRAFCSPIEDQGQVGSCAANAVVGAMEYHMRRAEAPMTDLSRLFVYYNARALANKEGEDCGTYIHHVMASVLAHGACPETMWPYVEAMWPMRPNESCYNAAQYFEAVQYARTPLGPVCKAALASGLPIVFGASLPSQWMYESGGEANHITRPRDGWPEPGGGHAMLIVGYDDAHNAWLIRNSWGADWGAQGHILVDYEVLANYSHPHAYWTIGAMEAHPSLSMQGPSVADTSMATSQAAADQVAQALALQKAHLRTEIETNLADKKAGIRSRLRGPGAGGGY